MTESKETEIVVAGFLYLNRMAENKIELKLRDTKVIGHLTYKADECLSTLLYRACENHWDKNVMIVIKVQNLDPEDK